MHKRRLESRLIALFTMQNGLALKGETGFVFHVIKNLIKIFNQPGETNI